MLERVHADRPGILVAHRPADVVMAAHIGHPPGASWWLAPPLQSLHREPDIASSHRRPQHHHQLVVVGEIAFGTVEVVPAEVGHQQVRADDRLGLEEQPRHREPGQRLERLQDPVRLRLVLAVGAEPLPEERRGIESQDVDAVVGQREHHAEHGPEHLRVGPVEVPLELVERRPHPLVGLG